MPDTEPGAARDGGHLRELLAERARRTPDAPAVLASGAPPLGYAALDDLVRAGAARLADWGVAREDRVVVPVGNDVDGVVTVLAVMCAAVCCPVVPWLAQEDFEAVFDVLEPTVVVLADGPSAGPLRRAAGTSDLAVLGHDGRLGPPAGAGPVRRVLPAGRELPRTVAGESVLLLTAGTEPCARIVPLTMAGMLAAATASARAHRLTGADRLLALDPLFRAEGLVDGVLGTLVSGSSLVCVPRPDPARVPGLLTAAGATWFSANPTAYRALLDHAPPTRPAGSRLRFARSVGAPMAAPLRREAEERFGAPVVECYGLPEAPHLACSPLPPGPAAAGLVPSGARIGVLDPDGRVRTGPGAAGGLVVAGPGVAPCYLWPREANASFTGGWLRTGDLGRIAADGSVLVTGPADDVIDRGGSPVVPFVVEEVLLGHPAVGTAVVFGVPDGRTEQVAAVVVPRAGRTVDEHSLRAYAAGRLAPFQVPERVVVRDRVPLGRAGLPVRRELPGLLGVPFPAAGRPALVAVPPPSDRTGGRCWRTDPVIRREPDSPV